MSREVYTTGGQTTLASGYTAGSGSLVLTDASSFPGSGVFSLVADPAGTPLWFKVTAIAGTTATVIVEQGTDRNLSSGVDVVEVQTARSLDAIRGECAMSGVSSSLPSAAVAGRLYLPTDEPILYRDSGSAWVSFGPVAPLVNPLAQTWGWENHVRATRTDQSGSITLSQNASGSGSGNYVEMIATALPAPSWRIRFAMMINICPDTEVNVFGGFAIRQTSNGHFYWFAIGGNAGALPKLTVYKFSGPSSYDGTLTADPKLRLFHNPMWFELENDGTYLYARWSADGQNFSTWLKVGVSEYLSSMDEFAIVVDTAPSGGVTNTSERLISFAFES
jgi:hypothetical protein